MSIARIAVDVPIDEVFDFRIPEGLEVAVGALVVVPFGSTRKVGVVVGLARKSAVPASRLRNIERRVEDVPPLGTADLDLYAFCASYYQRPLGEVIGAALPPRLRQVSRRAIRAIAPAP
ncbi:MAG: primosomal protein N', partial [Burkholderiales bacterium]|nr:primosomal protein N' [Burkholderiales bacterium]